MNLLCSECAHQDLNVHRHEPAKNGFSTYGSASPEDSTEGQESGTRWPMHSHSLLGYQNDKTSPCRPLFPPPALCEFGQSRLLVSYVELGFREGEFLLSADCTYTSSWLDVLLSTASLAYRTAVALFCLLFIYGYVGTQCFRRVDGSSNSGATGIPRGGYPLAFCLHPVHLRRWAQLNSTPTGRRTT